MQLNKKGISDELKETKTRELLSAEIYWDENSPLSIPSYVVKTSKCKKKCNLVIYRSSDFRHHKRCSEKQIRGIHKMYDFTKGGTDIIDQRMGFYTYKPKSRKWTTTVFSYVIDKACVTSSTTFALQKKNDPCQQDSF